MKLPAAVLISTGMIFGLCTMVYQNRTPIIEGTASAAEPSGNGVRTDDRPTRRALPSNGAPQFRQSSPVEAEIAANRARPGVLMASAPIEPRNSEAPPLPPLAHSAAVHTPVMRVREVVSDHEFVPRPEPEPTHHPDEVLLATRRTESADPQSGRDTLPAQSPETTVVVTGQGAGAQNSEHRAGSTYVVRAGDNLSRIAKRELRSDSPVTLAAIVALNPTLKGRPDKIVVGQKLSLPPVAGVHSEKGSSRVVHGAAPESSADRITPVNSPSRGELTKRVDAPGKSRSNATVGRKAASDKTTAAKNAEKPPTGKSDTAVAQAKPTGKNAARHSPSMSRSAKQTGGAAKAAGENDKKVASAKESRTGPTRTTVQKSTQKVVQAQERSAARNGTLDGVPDTIKAVEAKPGLKPVADGRKTQRPTPQPSRPKKMEVASGQTEPRDRTAGLKRITAR